VQSLARLIDVRADEYTEEQETSCEATLLFWYVGLGDTVGAGSDLAEVETAKAVIVVTAPEGGRLVEILVPEGEPVHPAQRLAVLECSD
jgi:pyruvate/2-oxoglutarate dehydrogenase complex dihydrolipoamide acyltransferase (E2) component